jgi:hypothetical protein
MTLKIYNNIITIIMRDYKLEVTDEDDSDTNQDLCYHNFAIHLLF